MKRSARIRAGRHPGSSSRNLPTARPEGPRPFTPRERQVLCGVFSGRTNKEIAHKLGVSESLVKAFVQQLFRKAGVRSRAQLVRAAVERYWKELEDGCEGVWN